jgi:hypothetical protein
MVPQRQPIVHTRIDSQEILAPSFLVFVDSSWGTIGSREAWAEDICAVTGIEEKQPFDFRSCCVATKLS